MAITIHRRRNRWEADFPFSYETKDVVKNAGFKFDWTNKVWFTMDEAIARRLDPAAAAAAVVETNAAIALSRATDAVSDAPVPAGLAYLGYQKACIEYAKERPGVLIADDMGLGKTVEAIGCINADPSMRRILVICPATLKINWKNELTKWLVRPLTVEIANGAFPESDVVILNYELLARYRSAIDAIRWDMLIVDEAHYCKNEEAQRTRLVVGHEPRGRGERIIPIVARKRLFLTGTPIVNRPKELWTLVHALDPHGLGRNFMSFMRRYTNAFHNGYGWDFSGAANLEELQQKMRAAFMIRRLKSEVLTELPAKRRQIVVLPVNGAAAAVRAEMAAFERIERERAAARAEADAAKAAGNDRAYVAAVARLRNTASVEFTEMSRLRHETALAKIPAVIAHLTDALESDGKFIVFVHHHDVGSALKAAFPAAAMVDGRTPVATRQAECDRFQNDPDCRLFIGSIAAAGVGITLTAAATVIFAELDWVPGNVSQAEDRAHRIGQRNSVLVQHLVFDGSVDSKMARMIIDKQAVIDAALNTPTAAVEMEAGLAREMAAVEAARHAPPVPAPVARPTAAEGGTALPDYEDIPF